MLVHHELELFYALSAPPALFTLFLLLILFKFSVKPQSHLSFLVKAKYCQRIFFTVLFQQHKTICLLCFMTFISPWFPGFKTPHLVIKRGASNLYRFPEASATTLNHLPEIVQDCCQNSYLAGMGMGPLGMRCLEPRCWRWILWVLLFAGWGIPVFFWCILWMSKCIGTCKVMRLHSCENENKPSVMKWRLKTQTHTWEANTPVYWDCLSLKGNTGKGRITDTDRKRRAGL